MMRSLLDALHDLVFPPFCFSCERRLEHSCPPLLCRACLASVVFLHPPWCWCCGIPFGAGDNHFCTVCLKQSFSFDLARSSLRYKPPVSDLLTSLKFSGNINVLESLHRLSVLSGVADELSVPDMILPVPLHIRRLQERKFNQALIIARRCFPEWRRRIEPMLLKRVGHTVAQSLLTGVERRRNLKGAFALTYPERVVGKKILLVDDVFTTGSTVEECARVLRKAGARRIEVFTLARSIGG